MRTLAAMVCLVVPLGAQERDDLLQWVPRQAQFVARGVGAAAWRAQFEATDLGRLIATPAFATTVQRLREALLPRLDLVDADVAAVEKLLGTLAGHDGEVVCAAGIDVASSLRDDAPHGWVVLAMDAGTATDLDAVATAARALLPELPSHEARIGGERVTLAELERGVLLPPQRQRGHLVMAVASEGEAGIERLFAPDGRLEVPADLPAGAFAMRTDLGALLSEVVAAAAAPAAPRELRTFAPVFEALVPGVRHWGFAVRADGAHVVQENWIEWDAPPRGVFALVAGRSGLPRLADLVPPAAGVWSVTSLATEPLRGLWRDVFGALGDDAPIGREAAEAAFTEFTKLRLFEDVVDLFDGSMLRVDATHGIEPLDSDDERAARVDERVGDRCYVLGLRDGARFATNLERALRARGLHAARKSEEYRGVRVYRLTLLGALPVEYAVTDTFLAVAVGGETTQQLLRGVLDMAVDRAAGRPPAELPAAVRQRLAELPDGALALARIIHQRTAASPPCRSLPALHGRTCPQRGIHHASGRTCRAPCQQAALQAFARALVNNAG